MSNFSSNVDLIYAAKLIILITEMPQNLVAFKLWHPLSLFILEDPEPPRKPCTSRSLFCNLLATVHSHPLWLLSTYTNRMTLGKKNSFFPLFFFLIPTCHTDKTNFGLKREIHTYLFERRSKRDGDLLHLVAAKRPDFVQAEARIVSSVGEHLVSCMGRRLPILGPWQGAESEAEPPGLKLAFHLGLSCGWQD